MVGDEHHAGRSQCRAEADHPHLEPEQAAGHGPVETCEGRFGAAWQQQEQHLDRHAGQRPQQHAASATHDAETAQQSRRLPPMVGSTSAFGAKPGAPAPGGGRMRRGGRREVSLMLAGIARSRFFNNGATVTLGGSLAVYRGQMRRILVLLIIAITVLVQDAATAADPQPYEVTLKPTGTRPWTARCTTRPR